MVFFVSFVLINLCDAVMITRIAWFLDRSKFILLIGFVLVVFIGFISLLLLWDFAHAAL